MRLIDELFEERQSSYTLVAHPRRTAILSGCEGPAAMPRDTYGTSHYSPLLRWINALGEAKQQRWCITASRGKGGEH